MLIYLCVSCISAEGILSISTVAAVSNEKVTRLLGVRYGIRPQRRGRDPQAVIMIN